MNEQAPRYYAIILCYSEQIEDMKRILREKHENDMRLATVGMQADNITERGGFVPERTPQLAPNPAPPSPTQAPPPTPSPPPLTYSPTTPPPPPTLTPTPEHADSPQHSSDSESQHISGRGGQPLNNIGLVNRVGTNDNGMSNGGERTASGIAGAAAIGAMPFNHDLFDDETIRDIIENGSRNGTARIDGPVELLTNAEAGLAGVGAGIFQIVDLITMSEYMIYIGFPPGNVHSDFTPMSPTDTATMLANAGGSWNWLPRPMVLKVGSRMLACGIHSFPHGSIMGSAMPGLGLSNQSNTKPLGGWPIGGHMCMYFKNSTGGTLGIREAAHAAYKIGNEIFSRQSTDSCVEARID